MRESYILPNVRESRPAAELRLASLARSQQNIAGPSPSVCPAARYSARSPSQMGAAANRSQRRPMDAAQRCVAKS
jgi:hypothetical protein